MRNLVSHRILLMFALLSAALSAVSLALWPISESQGAEWHMNGEGGTLEAGWGQGTFRIGVFDQTDYTPKWRWWGRRRTLSIDDVGPGLDFNMNLSGWGVSIPFPVLIVIWAIPPLWWVLVHRERVEHRRRVEKGLCLNCGYDASQSMSDVCPECGHNPRQLVSAQ